MQGSVKSSDKLSYNPLSLAYREDMIKPPGILSWVSRFASAGKVTLPSPPVNRQSRSSKGSCVLSAQELVVIHCNAPCHYFCCRRSNKHHFCACHVLDDVSLNSSAPESKQKGHFLFPKYISPPRRACHMNSPTDSPDSRLVAE